MYLVRNYALNGLKEAHTNVNMPFASEKQKKYLYANKPEVAKEFAAKEKMHTKKRPTKYRKYRLADGGAMKV